MIARACELMVRRKRGEEAMFPEPRPTHTRSTLIDTFCREPCSCLGAISHTVYALAAIPYTVPYMSFMVLYLSILCTSCHGGKPICGLLSERGFMLLADHSPILKNPGSLLAWLGTQSNFNWHVPKSLFSPAQRNMTRVPRWAVRHTPVFVLSESTVC